MDINQTEIVRKVIVESLNRADRNWAAVGKEFSMEESSVVFDSASLAKAESSKIPGYPFVHNRIPEVDEFIAMVVDMRNSTDHLKTVISNQKIDNGFHRIYLETSALLSAISETVSFEDGNVTEYLGDGALILFKVDSNDKQKTVRSASRAARYCIETMRDEINEQLKSRYNLDGINIGVGLSISKAMVTLVGETKNQQAKAIGQCVWEATKLSFSYNKINISNSLRAEWRKSKGGNIKFAKITQEKRGVSGYHIIKSDK